MLDIQPIPAFDDNYIWLLQPRTGGPVAVIDPGDARPVLKRLRSLGVDLGAIFITHHHRDHTGGIDQLLQHYQVPVYGPVSSRITQISHRLTDGDRLDFGGVTFQVIAVPGHTLDHIAYYAEGNEEDPVLFCGDTLFGAGCGRVFEGTAEQMHQSLCRLASLPDSSRVYCTHEYTLGNLAFAKAVEPDNTHIAQRLVDDGKLRSQQRPTLPSTLACEKLTNPFLRCEQPAVVASVANKCANPPPSDSETFALLRKWKDHFVT